MGTPSPTYQRKLFYKASFCYMRILFFTCSLVLLFSSCKKEDTEPPSVQINSPTENSVYEFNDFVSVAVRASDNKQVESVTVSVRNTAGAVVLRSELKSFSGKKTVEEDFFLHYDNIHLEEGTYYIYAEADDGENVSTTFQSIRLTPVPKVLQSIQVLVSDNNQSSLNTYSINGQALQEFPLTDNCFRFHINSYDQKIYTIGSAQTGIRTYGAENVNLERTVQIPFDLGSQLFVHSTWDSASRELFVTSNNPATYRIQNSGALGQELPTGRSLHAGVHSDYVVTYSIQNLTQRRLETYRKNTGFFIQSLSVPDSVVFLAAADENDRFIYLANRPFEPANSSGVLKVYDVEQLYLDEWTPLFLNAPETRILRAVRTSTGVAVAHVDKLRLYRFNGTRAEGTVYSPVDMHYDAVNQLLLLLESDRLVLLNAENLEEVGQIALSGALDVDVLYNK
jgi:hypothetical protein